MARVTRSKAIRLKCLDCCCGQANEVKLYPIVKCPLYPFRFGYEVDGEGKRIGKHISAKNAHMRDKNEEIRDD